MEKNYALIVLISCLGIIPCSSTVISIPSKIKKYPGALLRLGFFILIGSILSLGASATSHTSDAVAYYSFAHTAFGGIITNQADRNTNSGVIDVSGTSVIRENGWDALQLDGTVSSYMAVPVFRDFPTDTITVAFWLKTARDGVAGTFVSYAVGGHREEEGNLDDEFVIAKGRSGELIVTIKGISLIAGSVERLYNRQWHHLVVTWDGSSGEITIYLDGQWIEFKDRDRHYITTEGGAIETVAPHQRLRGGGSLVFGQDQDCKYPTQCSPDGEVGSRGGGFAQDQSFPGFMDNIALYRKVMPADEVRALYRKGRYDFPGDACTDNSGNAGVMTWSYYLPSEQSLLDRNAPPRRHGCCPVNSCINRQGGCLRKGLAGTGEYCDWDSNWRRCTADGNGQHTADKRYRCDGSRWRLIRQNVAPDPPDADEDGVEDREDRCSGTSQGRGRVYSEGATAGCLFGDRDKNNCVNLLDIWSGGSRFPRRAIQNINLWC